MPSPAEPPIPPVPPGPDVALKLEAPRLKLADEPMCAEELALPEGLVEPLPLLPFAIGAEPVPIDDIGPTPRAEPDEIPFVTEWLVPGILGVEEAEDDEPLLPAWPALEEPDADPGWVWAEPVPKGLELALPLAWPPAPEPLALPEEWPLPPAALPERVPPPCEALAGPDAELTEPLGVGARELVGPAWVEVAGVVGCAAEPGVAEGAGAS